ncbi:hypothetical protein [Pedobacter paludis]|uniref:Uncharacterized protein n=1 Tax=Pedobacter paludis TaxID=2203212 RepID=A0A317EV85_9SPHI|nr:hypothetical protein [Pedobacter paludis]PWS30860.1 hypothetical protein DF947_14715 [Pedobacter paludis]
MKYLKIISITSFLLINGLGPHGIPNFAGILLCLLCLIDSLLSQTFFGISWGLGIIGVLSLASLISISFSRPHKDHFLLIFAFIALTGFEVFLSDILHHQKLIFWFVFPLLLFVVSSILLIIKSFESQKELTTF